MVRCARCLHTYENHAKYLYVSQVKVAVMGAAGGIGQPLSMLMKMNPLVSELSLYDVVNTPGVAVDLSHCDTAAKVTGYVGQGQLDAALHGCQLVVIPAGASVTIGLIATTLNL
jgi:malate dehydrogenase